MTTMLSVNTQIQTYHGDSPFVKIRVNAIVQETGSDMKYQYGLDSTVKVNDFNDYYDRIMDGIKNDLGAIIKQNRHLFSLKVGE